MRGINIFLLYAKNLTTLGSTEHRMPQQTKETKERNAGRADGRRQMLAYLRPEVIHKVKVLAALEQRHAYEVIEDALEAHLANKPGLPK